LKIELAKNAVHPLFDVPLQIVYRWAQVAVDEQPGATDETGWRCSFPRANRGGRTAYDTQNDIVAVHLFQRGREVLFRPAGRLKSNVPWQRLPDRIGLRWKCRVRVKVDVNDRRLRECEGRKGPQ
jgi:hypothetical protein